MSHIESKKIKKLLFISAIIIIMLFIIIPIIVSILPQFIILIKNPNNENIAKYLHSFGIRGIIVLIILQAFQVLSFIIPSPSIWLISGITYGTIKGLVICIAGIAIGNSIAFLLGKKFGNKLLSILINEKKLSKLDFIENSKHTALVIFILYLIPIIPNSIIPYIYARTNISLKKFVLEATAACIPLILFNAYAGDSAITGNLTIALTILALFAIIFLVVLRRNKRIMHLIEKLSNKKSKD